MGRAHSRAMFLLQTLEDAPVAIPVLRAVCGRDSQRLASFRERYAWERSVQSWTELVADPEIDVFDNTAPNDLHAEPTIAAARAGKHVVCEKPMGRNADEAQRMLDAAESAGVVHMCAFNYRFLPAIRLAKQLIDRGDLGEVRQFSTRFLVRSDGDPTAPESPWRLLRARAGSGVVADLLSHHVDLARYLVGEMTAVSAVTRAWSPESDGVTMDVEDAVMCAVEFERGAIGTLEAARSNPGHVLKSQVAVDGSKGSVAFDLQRLNELTVSTMAGELRINVTSSEHPYSHLWWPPGHGIGWGDTFVHELRHFLGAVAGAWPVAPDGATFVDGYRCAQVCDAVLAAADSGVRQEIPSVNSAPIVLDQRDAR